MKYSCKLFECVVALKTSTHMLTMFLLFTNVHLYPQGFPSLPPAAINTTTQTHIQVLVAYHPINSYLR